MKVRATGEIFSAFLTHSSPYFCYFVSFSLVRKNIHTFQIGGKICVFPPQIMLGHSPPPPVRLKNIYPCIALTGELFIPLITYFSFILLLWFIFVCYYLQLRRLEGSIFLLKVEIFPPPPLKNMCEFFLPHRGNFWAPQAQFFSLFSLKSSHLCHKFHLYYHILSHFLSLTLILLNKQINKVIFDTIFTHFLKIL